ncbi:hypothetical protein L1277_000302 [Okibacterium sp. HSC-33S16]|uniref:hypothetical protein n=1 Tax=Okibacterium sp. HSC-33S16 TaxID=2910965 RepID=UPI00209EB0C4|nr:hypothetical protein [Okibacterium sp. HSC-33S16]MCP2030238.1 hypothetical protein [Okibacterium sp. HSC-33S16]
MTISEQTSSVNDEAVLRATGRTRSTWHELLSTAGAHDWNHFDTAAWLVREHGVDGWWAQGISVGYEKQTARRKPGQRADGRFEVTVSRRVPLDQQEALHAVIARVGNEIGADPTSTRAKTKYVTAKWKREGGVITARVAPSENGKSPIALAMTVASDTDLPAAKALLTSWLPEA